MNPDRREFLALGVGALAVAALPAALRGRPRLVRRSVPVMGTIAEVAVRSRNERWAQRAIDAAFGELRRVEAEMTRFRPDSDVGRANLAAGAPVRVSVETAEVLRRARAWAEASDGLFDPCLGGAVELWDVAHRHEPPPEEEVARYAARRLWQALDVEGLDAPRARLNAPDARLDLGGIAKGYGVDRAAEALRAMGVFHALVNVGGDLVALGTDADGEPWRVGIRSPDRADRIVDVVEVSDAAVATSGDYLQFFQYGGRRYHHMLDPRTGAPRRTAMHSLTVQAEGCVDADAAATALFGLPPAQRETTLVAAPAPVRIVHTV